MPVTRAFLRTLAHFCYGEIPLCRVSAVFLIGLTSLLGFRPQVGHCARCAQAIDTQGGAEFAAAFSPEAGGVLCPSCSAGAKCRLHAREVLYLQGIMRKGLASLEEEGECPDALFEALQQMAEEKMDVPIRSGRML